MSDAPAAFPVPLPRDDLAGVTVALDASTSLVDNATVMIGGSPLRIARLTGAGGALVKKLVTGEPVPRGDQATALTRRLLDGGLVHPDGLAPVNPSLAVTVVVPVRGSLGDGLMAALEALPDGLRIVVVDDASPAPVTTTSRRIEIVRRPVNGGPAAARNTGLGEVSTTYTAFVDADCEPDPGWIEGLLVHFADPLVAAVGPRIVGPAGPTGSVLARYENARAPLDLGARPARVRARSRVSYLPSAALVVRTDVVRGLGGFDEAMPVGEDVDLVWRLDEAGWTVRYEPSVRVMHRHRTELWAWARRRYDYGTSAGPLAARHPGALAPVEASASSVALWALLATGHPLAALATGAVTVDLLARRLAALQHPFPVAARLAAQGHLSAGKLLAESMLRPWWPLTFAAALTSRRARRVILAAVVLPPLWEWVRDRPPLDPVRWVVCRVSDQIAYGTGVWAGAWKVRTVDPLRPELTSWPRPGRYTRWRSTLSRR